MADFICKAGDSLKDYRSQLMDRSLPPVALDLTNATSVLMYVRLANATTNVVNGEACTVTDANDGKIQGPDHALTTPGDYEAYFKAVFGSSVMRIPSSGYIQLRCEDSFE